MSVALATRAGRVLVVLVASSLPLGCGGAAAVSDHDLATVHGALLAHLRARSVEAGRSAPVFVVRQMSAVDLGFYDTWPDGDPPEWFRYRPEADWEWVRDELAGVTREMWDSFVASNREPQDLSRTVRFSGTISWLSGEERRDLFSEGIDAGYMRFRRRHPDAGSINAMSRPGVSKDGSQALVYLEGASGGHAGSGHYYVLSRDEGIWRVVDQFMAWMA